MFIDFRERKVRGRKRNIGVRNITGLSPTLPNPDGTHSLGMCPDQELNLQPFGVRNDALTN